MNRHGVRLALTVVALGSIHSGNNNNNSGSSPSAIQAGYNPNGGGAFTPGVFGDVSVVLGANIVADAGDGINAYNYGTGDISVNLGFNVSIQALTSANSQSGNGNSPFGIGAFNYGDSRRATAEAGVGSDARVSSRSARRGWKGLSASRYGAR